MMKQLRRLYGLYVNNTIYPFFRFLSRKKLKKYKHLVKGDLLDIGCGDKPYRDLFSHVKRYVGTNSDDYYEGNLFFTPGGDDVIVNDGCDLPFDTESFNTVLNLQVLPVFDSPDRFFQEVYRVLKKKGIFIITADFLYPIWNKPYNYFRVTSFGFEVLGKRNGFEVIAIEPFEGFGFMCARNLHKYLIRQLANIFNDVKKTKNCFLTSLKILKFFVWSIFSFFIPLLVNLAYILGMLWDKIMPDEDFTTNYIAVFIKK